MKIPLLVVVGLTFLLGVTLLAQSIVGGPPLDLPKTRPPLSLTGAYALALRKLGAETNTFYCVDASSRVSNSKGFRGWTFTFWSTNDVHFEVFVVYNGEVFPQRKSQ